MLLSIVLFLPTCLAGFYDYYGSPDTDIPDVTIHQDDYHYDDDDSAQAAIKQPIQAIDSTTINPSTIISVPIAIETTVPALLTTIPSSPKLSPSFETINILDDKDADSSIIPSLAPDDFYDYSSSQSTDLLDPSSDDFDEGFL